MTVHPPLDSFFPLERADQLAAEGLFADDAAGLAAADQAVAGQWERAVERARRLPAAMLDERVADEWSFLETLRHLVFVTDIWIREVVEARERPCHPWGVPPDFAAEMAVPAYGLDVDARPSLDEILAVRADRRVEAAAVFSAQTDESLSQAAPGRGGRFLVVGALQTVVSEEWSHLQFAERDLAVLEAR